MRPSSKRKRVFLPLLFSQGYCGKWPSVMGSAGFADRVKKKFFSKKRHKEVAESKLLAPDVSVVRDMVCRSYGVKEEELLVSRRGRRNEALPQIRQILGP